MDSATLDKKAQDLMNKKNLSECFSASDGLLFYKERDALKYACQNRLQVQKHIKKLKNGAK